MSEEQKEKKKYENGTIAVQHLIVESAKLNASIKKLDGSTYQGARIVATGKFGSSEIKIAQKSLDQPFNAALKKQVTDLCDQFKIAFANDEELKITYEKVYNAKTSYWNPVSIQIGHIGREGLQNAGGGQQGGNGGNGGGGYNNEDAAAGQVMNIAVAMLQAKAKKEGFTMEQVEELAIEIASDYKSAKENVKAAMRGSAPAKSDDKTTTTVEGTDAEVSEAGSDDMSFDDDIPY